MNRSIPIFVSLLSLSLNAPTARAAIFCVTNPAQLQNALTAAQSNGEHDQVRLHVGTYASPAGGFVYNPGSSESFDLDVSGGWTAFFDNPCGVQGTDPWSTLLDGGGQRRVMRLFADADAGDISVKLLTFTNGFVAPGLGGGLSVSYLGDTSGTMTIERNVFLANEADQAGGLDAQGATVQKVVNNLFVLNQAGSRGAVFMTTTGIFGVVFANNTVIGQNHSNTGQPTATFAGPRVYVANNNFWDNDGHDAEIVGDGDRWFIHNNYQSLAAGGGAIVEDNISVEPEYEGGLFDFTPVRGSPLVDAGLEPQGTALWYLAPLDLNGAARTVGPHVDIGAFENERIFADGFDPPGIFGR